MEKLKYLRWTLLASLAVFAVSCRSVSPNGPNDGTKFYDGAAANVVVRFYGWNSIQMTRPDTREQGFLPMLDRESAARELDRPGVGRDLAVVVMGHLYTANQEVEVFRDWKAILGERGFRRLVMLRASGNYNIDGLIILRESAIAALDDEQRKVAATFAAIAATAGTDVADSSVNSIP